MIFILSPFLTVPEVASYLRIPESKVYELVRSKGFPAKKIGKSWRIHKVKLEEWAVSFGN